MSEEGPVRFRRDSRVSTDFRVRRRNYRDLPYLSYHNQFLELDEIGDAVWLMLDEQPTVEALTHMVEGRFALPLDEAFAEVAWKLAWFSRLGWIRFHDDEGAVPDHA